jgi:hypothetical protein
MNDLSHTSKETIEINPFENDYDNSESLDNGTFYHESKCSPLLSGDRLGPMRAADPIPFRGTVSMSPLHIEKGGNNLSKFGKVTVHDKSFKCNIKGVGGSMNCLTEGNSYFSISFIRMHVKSYTCIHLCVCI